MQRTHRLHKAKKELAKTEDLPIWRQSLSDTHTETKQLDKEFQLALNELRGKQRKFVLNYATGNMTEAESLIKAGYSKSNTSFQKRKLLENKNVVRALSLAHTAFSLKHGISSRWKRQKLINLYEICADPEHEKFNAMGAVKAMQLLQSMDGDIAGSQGSSGNAGVSITIQTGVPEQRVVVELPHEGSSQDKKAGNIIDAEPD